MNLTKLLPLAITALLLSPASAQDSTDKAVQDESGYHSQIPRYEFKIEPGNVMLFRKPVSFTGEVIEKTSHSRTLRAANGMTITIPNQALVWNGDTQIFGQASEMGDKVVVYMRSEEPYRIMLAPTVARPTLAIGSYDGVYYLSEDFIADLDLENLDNNIYADRNSKDEASTYDVDLSSVKDAKDL
ncbi:MAG: hypothetical protein WC314_05715 [Vulcanimicrobiota bacterium]